MTDDISADIQRLEREIQQLETQRSAYTNSPPFSKEMAQRAVQAMTSDIEEKLRQLRQLREARDRKNGT